MQLSISNVILSQHVELELVFVITVVLSHVCLFITGKLQNDGANLFQLFYQPGENYATFNIDDDYEPAFYESELAAEQAAAQTEAQAGDTSRQEALDAAISTCDGSRECLFDWLLLRA